MKKIVTHNGEFHADDVFAIATMQLLFGKEEIEVIRTRDESIIQTGDYVIDVGGVYDHDARRYDHHQPGAPIRENGIPYAAFGLVWKHYGEMVSGSTEVAAAIEETICQQVDATDNGMMISQMNEYSVKQITFDGFIKTWAADTGSLEEMDRNFHIIVDICRDYLQRVIQKTQKKLEDKKYALDLYEQTEDKRLIVSEQGFSSRLLTETEAVVLVMPDSTVGSSRWVVVTVPVDDVSFDVKARFPEAWAGLRDSELVSVSGVDDMVFCHKNRHLVITASKESALQVAEVVLI